MLGRVALHDELAELRAVVGPQVFEDPVAFRAAFDDFVPEGSATTGEVSLLVGAIATGALQRLRDQLAIGADPETSIAVQGDLLARDRGTTETAGAQWALSALAHALGAVPADLVLTRPTPGPDSISTAARSGTPAPEVSDPGPTRRAGAPETMPPAPATPTRAIRQEPSPPTSGQVVETGQGRSRTNPMLIGVVAVLAVVAATAIVLLFLREDDPADPALDNSTGGASDVGEPADEEVLSTADITDAEEPFRVEMVRNGSEVELVLSAERDGELTEVDRAPVSCPYLETSYEPAIRHSGGLDLFWGWQNLDQDGFGEYGRVLPEIERLEIFGLEEGYVCPTE